MTLPKTWQIDGIKGQPWTRSEDSIVVFWSKLSRWGKCWTEIPVARNRKALKYVAVVCEPWLIQEGYRPL